MKILPSAALLLFTCLPHAKAQVATRPLVDAWRKCAFERAATFIKSGEPAETIAKAAAFECRDLERAASSGLLSGGTPPNVVLATMDKLSDELRDMLVAYVVKEKSK